MNAVVVKSYRTDTLFIELDNMVFKFSPLFCKIHLLN